MTQNRTECRVPCLEASAGPQTLPRLHLQGKSSFHLNPWGPRLRALSPVRDLNADLLSCWMLCHKRYLCLALQQGLVSSSVLLKGARRRLWECSARALRVGAVLAGSVPSEGAGMGSVPEPLGRAGGMLPTAPASPSPARTGPSGLPLAGQTVLSQREAAALAGKLFGFYSRGTERSQGNFPAFPLA